MAFYQSGPVIRDERWPLDGGQLRHSLERAERIEKAGAGPAWVWQVSDTGARDVISRKGQHRAMIDLLASLEAEGILVTDGHELAAELRLVDESPSVRRAMRQAQRRARAS